MPSYSCTDGVERAKGYICRLDNQPVVTACGVKWCSKVDADCRDSRMDDDFFWAFDSEDSCEEDYGELKDFRTSTIGGAVIAFMVASCAHIGAIVVAFMYPARPRDTDVPMAVVPGRPAEGVPVQGDLSDPSGQLDNAGQPTSESGLPPGWHEATTEEGAVYYYNETGGTTWDFPTAPPPPLEEKNMV